MERNGFWGTDYFLERNGTFFYGTNYLWNGTERHGTVHPCTLKESCVNKCNDDFLHNVFVFIMQLSSCHLAPHKQRFFSVSCLLQIIYNPSCSNEAAVRTGYKSCTLHGTWKALDACKILPQDVETICPYF